PWALRRTATGSRTTSFTCTLRTTCVGTRSTTFFCTLRVTHTGTFSHTTSCTFRETVCVPGRLTWKSVPTYSCEFDPCTCTHVQKQTGCRKHLVREAAHTEQRQVTRNRTVTEQVQET